MPTKKILIVSSLALFLLFPSFVFAEGADTHYGADTAANKAQLSNSIVGQTGLAELIGEVVKIALSFIGIIFFLLVLYAGFIWMTAMGNTEKVTKAKDILEAAVIGLVLVASAYAISSFVFSRLAGGSENSTATNSTTANSTATNNTVYVCCLCEQSQAEGQASSAQWTAGQSYSSQSACLANTGASPKWVAASTCNGTCP